LGLGVKVGVGVRLGDGVLVEVGVLVLVAVGVLVGVWVGVVVGVGVGVWVGVNVSVGVQVLVGVAVGGTSVLVTWATGIGVGVGTIGPQAATRNDRNRTIGTAPCILLTHPVSIVASFSLWIRLREYDATKRNAEHVLLTCAGVIFGATGRFLCLPPLPRSNCTSIVPVFTTIIS
jgi:hypothetical protein